MSCPVHVWFVTAGSGSWQIDHVIPVVGEPLAEAPRLDVVQGQARPPGKHTWALHGVVSNERYVTRAERAALSAVQETLGRPAATAAVLIPVRKSAAWWDLTQDERRDVFEERSRHIAIGLTALPAVSRRLHHSRDLGEPFDFLTWFEFAPEDRSAFNEVLQQLRSTPEWTFVDREVEIRLTRTR